MEELSGLQKAEQTSFLRPGRGDTALVLCQGGCRWKACPTRKPTCTVDLKETKGAVFFGDFRSTLRANAHRSGPAPLQQGWSKEDRFPVRSRG